MSGIAGIFNRYGKSINDDISTSFLNAMSYWHPDDKGTLKQDNMALFHTMLWNTPESMSDHLPKKVKHLAITIDARLDNRDELAKLLKIANNQQTPDSDFVLSAYLKWGEACPQHLLGDFAFAIWDTKKQHLFCARDQVGIKQFYFHLTDHLFVFGNDLKGLTQYPEISEEINDQAVANFIVNSQLIHPSLTFFKDIRQLPPAHSITITKNHTQTNCYWKLEDAPKVTLPDAKAYAEELNKLLKQAVHDRMRTAYPVTSHLSGGLDSSSIAVIAAKKLREKGEKLLAYNWVPEPTADEDPEHHEWSNSRIVAETEDIDHHYVALNSEDLKQYMNNRNIAYGESATFWYEYPVREAAHRNGSRTLLSGWGGDELATYHGQSYYCDLFLQGKIKMLLHEIHCKVKKKGINHFKKTFSILYHSIFMLLVPRRLYCYLPKNRSLAKPLFPFVNKIFKRAIKHELQIPRELSMQPQRTIRKHMLAFWRNGHLQSRIESWSTAAIPKRLEYCYPLLDRRIIEFAIGIPTEFWIKDGVSRYIFRSAVSETLPEKIVWGNSKLELNSVKHLLSLSISACISIAKQIHPENKQTKYINFGKLRKTTQGIELHCSEQKASAMITDIETSISTRNL